MNLSERAILAGFILVLDLVFFVIPLTAVFAVYVIFRRPLWFRDWVLKLYAE